MNFHPIEEASNKSMGILVVDQAPKKIKVQRRNDDEPFNHTQYLISWEEIFL
jgi:hypothetical protein